LSSKTENPASLEERFSFPVEELLADWQTILKNNRKMMKYLFINFTRRLLKNIPSLVFSLSIPIRSIFYFSGLATPPQKNHLRQYRQQIKDLKEKCAKDYLHYPVPDGESALMLVAARLRYITGTYRISLYYLATATASSLVFNEQDQFD